MYLRKRYKKLQRCKVSRLPNVQNVGPEGARGSLDPSFKAIQALNGQSGARPEPVVVRATIKDAKRGHADKMKPLPPTPQDRITGKPQDTASIQHATNSFSARVDRLVQAIEGGQRLRFAPSDESTRIYVFARDMPAPDTSFGGNAPFEHTVERSNDTVASAGQQQDLENRIRGRIAELASEAQQGSVATVVRRERHMGVDPRIIQSHGTDVKCHRISPIPLSYQKPCNPATPSLNSSDTASHLSSPLDQAGARQVPRAKEPAFSTRSGRSVDTTDAVKSWVPEITPSGGSSQTMGSRPGKGKTTIVERHEKNLGIVSWLRRVKEALSPRKKPPVKTSGKVMSVFRDNSLSNSNRWAREPIARPDKALRDVTNVRKSSFAQEREAKIQHRVKRKRQPAAVPRATAPQRHKVANPPTTTDTRSGRPKHQDDLHPDVLFALARLEGRVPPPPASPIQRWTDNADTYGPDVEVELGHLTLNCPRPVRTPSYSVTDRLQRSVNAGFDAALAAPLGPEARAYLRSVR